MTAGDAPFRNFFFDIWSHRKLSRARDLLSELFRASSFELRNSDFLHGPSARRTPSPLSIAWRAVALCEGGSALESRADQTGQPRSEVNGLTLLATRHMFAFRRTRRGGSPRRWLQDGVCAVRGLAAARSPWQHNENRTRCRSTTHPFKVGTLRLMCCEKISNARENQMETNYTHNKQPNRLLCHIPLLNAERTVE